MRHPCRLFALILLYLCLLGTCSWYVTRWADYPPEAQPYTRPLRTRPPTPAPAPPGIGTFSPFHRYRQHRRRIDVFSPYHRYFQGS